MFSETFRFIQKAAVLHPDEARVLLLRRAAADTYRPGDWDIPGGNVEWGELHGAALAREVFEETGLLIEEFKPLRVVSSVDLNGTYVLHIVYTCRAEVSEVVLSREHQSYRWLDRAELEHEVTNRSKYMAWALEALAVHL